MRRAVLAVCVITCPIGGCDYRGRGLAPDGAGGDDDTVDARGNGVATCGKPGAIVDDFADGLTGDQWQLVAASYGDVTEVGGELVITPSDGLAGYYGLAGVDLRDAGIEVEVPTMVTAGSATFAAANRGLSISLTWRGGMLTAHVDKPSSPATYQVPYDPAAHRWWRIADVGGTVTISTSPEGTSWAPILTSTGVPYTSAVTVQLYADATGVATGPPGAVTYRNLRASEYGVAVGRAPWCKAATFTDRFDGGMVGFAWTPSANPQGVCDPRVGGNKLHLDQPGAACVAAVHTMALLDLTDSAIVLDVDAIGELGYYLSAQLAITSPSTQDRAAIRAGNYQLCGMIGDYDDQCTPYDGATQRYWRLRGDAGDLVWEASPDRVDWVPLRTQQAPFDLSRVKIMISSLRQYDGSPAMNFASPGLNP